MEEQTTVPDAAPGTTYRPSALRRRLSRSRAKLSRSLARIEYTARWDYFTNPRSRRLFREHPPALTDAQQRAATELHTRGIAFSSAAELGVDALTLAQVQTIVEEFARGPKVRDRIAKFPEEFQRRKMSGDDYLVKLYPDQPTLAWDNPLLQVGLGAPLLNVVNAYLGMFAKLIYADAWHTIPIDMGRRIGSQDWHRDPEDRKMIKAYLYFADVDIGAGPMEYVPGSMLGGPLDRAWGWKPFKTHVQRYPNEEEFEYRMQGVERLLCTGSAGTFILCDTSGLHRGGISRTKPRILATWTFVTPASMSLTAYRRFVVDYGGARPSLTPAARYALSEAGGM